MKKIFTLLLVSFSLSLFAQWTDDKGLNTMVSGSVDEVYEWDFAVNPDNSITTVFSAPLNNRIEVWYNIHNSDGVSILPDNAKKLASAPTMTWTVFGNIAFHDSEGNMLVIYQNCRIAEENDMPIEGTSYLNYDIYKISPTGELLWDKPLDLSRGYFSEDIQASLSVSELEDGSYMFAYCDYRYNKEGGQIGRICIERVSSDGEMLWEEPMWIEDAAIQYAYPYLISSTDNQTLLLYVKGSNQDLVMRKLDFDGSSVWGKDVVVYRGGFPSVPVWTLLSVISDGEGGAFVGWRDDRYFTDYEKSYVSHILSDGSYGYASGVDAEALGYSEGMRSFEPTMLYDKEEKVLYTLRRETSSSQAYQRLMIQKTADTGELLWGPEGVEMRPADGSAVAYFDLQFAEDGNVVAFYMVQHDGVNVSAYAHKFNKETGEAMWLQPLEFTSAEGSRSSLKVSPLVNNGYWIAMWKDSRRLEGEEDLVMAPTRLYMQRINVDGSLGVKTEIELVKDNLDVFVEGRSIVAPVDAEIYTINGIRVASENLLPGVYVVCSGGKTVKVAIK